MSDAVKFIQTTSSTLGSIPVKAGQVIFCTDTNTVYQDTIGGGRVEYGLSTSDKVKLDRLRLSSIAKNTPEVWSIGAAWPGYITDGGKAVKFSVSISHISGNDIEAGFGTVSSPIWTKCTLAQAGLTASCRSTGYVDNVQYLDTSTTNIELVSKTAAAINFSLTKQDGSAWTNVTNNYACTVSMSGTILLRWM